MKPDRLRAEQSVPQPGSNYTTLWDTTMVAFHVVNVECLLAQDFASPFEIPGHFSFSALDGLQEAAKAICVDEIAWRSAPQRGLYLCPLLIDLPTLRRREFVEIDLGMSRSMLKFPGAGDPG